MPLDASTSAVMIPAPSTVMFPSTSAKETASLPSSVLAERWVIMSLRRMRLGITCALSTLASCEGSAINALIVSSLNAANASFDGANTVQGPSFALPSCSARPAVTTNLSSVESLGSWPTTSATERVSGIMTRSITYTTPLSNGTSVFRSEAPAIFSASPSMTRFWPDSARTPRRCKREPESMAIGRM